MSATDTYSTALRHHSLAPFTAKLRKCRASHAKRARSLRGRIEALGGKAPHSPGIWGGFADILEEDVGAQLALRALEQGEAHDLRDYREDLRLLDRETQSFVEKEILPEQIQTFRSIEALRRSLP